MDLKRVNLNENAHFSKFVIEFYKSITFIKNQQKHKKPICC